MSSNWLKFNIIELIDTINVITNASTKTIENEELKMNTTLFFLVILTCIKLAAVTPRPSSAKEIKVGILHNIIQLLYKLFPLKWIKRGITANCTNKFTKKDIEVAVKFFLIKIGLLF